MNIENIEAFVLVNHFGSINKAAKALFLTQPTVTSRIQSLERELDTELFERVGKKLVITEQAKEFLPFAEGIIRIYKLGKKRLKEKESSNQLTIGCTRLISHYLIPNVLPTFIEKYPNVRVKLVTDSGDVILNKVLDREVDIGFVSRSSNPLIESSKVMESPIQLFVQPSHPFAAGGLIDLEELSKEPIIFFECGSLDWSMVQNMFQSLSQVPNIKYEVDTMETAKGLILNGTGIGFLPELSVRREVSKGELVAVDIPIIANLTLKTNMIHHKGEIPIYFEDVFKIAKDEGKNFVPI